MHGPSIPPLSSHTGQYSLVGGGVGLGSLAVLIVCPSPSSGHVDVFIVALAIGVHVELVVADIGLRLFQANLALSLSAKLALTSALQRHFIP